MNSWIVKSIGDLCDGGNGVIQTGPFGSQLHQSDYSDEGIPVVMPADIHDGSISEEKIARVSESHVERLSRHKLALGDIVYGRRGDIGRQALVRQENIGWLCGTGCLRITLGNADVIPEYLHLYLKISEVVDWIANQAIGATMPNLNTSILKRVPIRFPYKKSEQEKIVGIISAYDDLIENNKRRITLLENMAEELYREWFVRFRFPGWRDAEFEKGIPRGWENKRFDDFCTLQRGYDLPDADIEPGDFPVVASTSIKAFHKEFKVKPPIVATGRSGSLGTVQFIQKKAWPLNTCLFVKDFKGNSPYLVYFILKAMRLENFNAGAGVPSLNRNHLAALKLAVPEQTIQQKFDEIISPIFKSLTQQAELTENLTKTKNALLPRLISGKLAVEDLAVQLPPSMREAS